MNEKSQPCGWSCYVKALTIGILFGAITILLLFVIFSLAIVKFNFPASAISLVVILSSAIGALVSGFLAAKIVHQKGILVGLMSGLLFSLILLLSTLLFSGSFNIGENISKYAAILAASIIGGVFGVNSKSHRRKG